MTPTRHSTFRAALPRGLACLLLSVLCLLPTAAPAAEAVDTDRPPTAEEVERLRETQVLLFQRFVEIVERQAAARDQAAQDTEPAEAAPAAPAGEEGVDPRWTRLLLSARLKFTQAEETFADMVREQAEAGERHTRMLVQLGGLVAAIILVYFFAVRPFLAAGRKSTGAGATSRPVRSETRPGRGETPTLSRAEQYEEWKRQRQAQRDKIK